jgi:hypothetical protein
VHFEFVVLWLVVKCGGFGSHLLLSAEKEKLDNDNQGNKLQ